MASVGGNVTPAPIEKVIARIQATSAGWNRATSIEQMRRDWDDLFAAPRLSASIEPATIGSVKVEWISAPGSRCDQAVLYLHGGGFKIGSLNSHRELMANISSAAGCRVVGVGYRLSPEWVFPAALEDVISVFRWLRSQGYQPHDLAFAGDSAGAGLVLSTMLALRDAHQELPAAAVLMSPWTDLTASGPSYQSRADADPIHRRKTILAMAGDYLGSDGDARSPLVSPLFADLEGLPPLLIQAGDREIVLSDSTLLAEKARAAGVEVIIEIWEGMIHVFQQFPDELVEARKALKSAGDFLRKYLAVRAASEGK
jgi:epsilon-lactone hydrolase